MQNFKDLYQELADKINALEKIRWIDLWHNQVSFLETEHPFPTPAVFLQFRSRQINDIGGKVQNMNLQVDVFLFYETFLDTYHEGINEDDALEFLDALDDLNRILHGSEGDNYSSMRRISIAPVDTGGSGNLYQLSYECALLDYSAQSNSEEANIPDVELEKFAPILP